MEMQIRDKPKVAKAPVLGGVCFLRALGALAIILVPYRRSPQAFRLQV
jgi:hypothetical protein